MTEAEAASYVLAHLLNNNYSQTATAFLQECNVLPSKTLLVLPETPLQSIIADHKSRKDTSILVNTLGTVSALTALWNKLDHTLKQLRTLCEDNISPAQSTKHGSLASSVRSRPSRSAHRNKKPPLGSQPHTALPPPESQPHTSTTKHPLESKLHSTQPTPGSQSHTPPPHTLTSSTTSPRKRKTAPKRKSSAVSPSASLAPMVLPAAPPSPSLQHVLDSLMEDNELPGKLADIINRCVSKEDMDTGDITSGVSPSTLDDILDLTYADPTLEGLISHMTTSTDHVTASSSSAIGMPTAPLTQTIEDQVPPPPKRQRTRDPTCSTSEETAALTEQDIDDFLDQLHSSSS